MNKRNNKNYDFLLLDIFSLISSFFIAYYLRHRNIDIFKLDIYRDMFFVIVVLNVLINSIYEPFKTIFQRDRYEELRTTFIFDLLSFISSVTYLFIIKAGNEYSRITLFLTYIIYFLLSYFSRILLKRHIRNKAKSATKRGDKSLLIICKNNDIDEVIKNIYNNNYDYYYISGICLIDENKVGERYKNYNIVANLDGLLSYVSTNWVDDIFIATDYKQIPNDVLAGLKDTGINIHFILEESQIFSGRKQSINTLGVYNVISVTNNEYNSFALFVKRIIDIVGGIIGCLITLVLIVILGPIIYIKSPGNIIYCSERVGKNGKTFKFYKFRSMVNNADDLKDSLKEQNRVKDGMMFKIENDPRIIPGIGTFIRKTSLDEFPQFYNVLKGDMSLVGTRPPTLDEWNKYSPYYRSRLTIKPGITGLWQISGRSNITDFDEVVKLDNEYINNWSLLLDIKILFRTIITLFNRKGNGAL